MAQCVSLAPTCGLWRTDSLLLLWVWRVPPLYTGPQCFWERRQKEKLVLPGRVQKRSSPQFQARSVCSGQNTFFSRLNGKSLWPLPSSLGLPWRLQWLLEMLPEAHAGGQRISAEVPLWAVTPVGIRVDATQSRQEQEDSRVTWLHEGPDRTVGSSPQGPKGHGERNKRGNWVALGSPPTSWVPHIPPGPKWQATITGKCWSYKLF